MWFLGVVIEFDQLADLQRDGGSVVMIIADSSKVPVYRKLLSYKKSENKKTLEETRYTGYRLTLDVEYLLNNRIARTVMHSEIYRLRKKCA